MITARFFWHDYQYFPYERDLACREIKAIFHEEPQSSENGIVVSFSNDKAKLISRPTYFKGVEIGTEIFVPDQARLEASTLTKGQAWDPKRQTFPVLRRQSTRYSAHGLHEYKGKFNPQIVRAIGNLIGLESDSWVLDPFCGSGTTLLEAAHIGWNALGFDVNPLGVLIANAKVAAFKASPKKLREHSVDLLANLEFTSGEDWKQYLPNSTYLSQWFTLPVLKDLVRIRKAIELVTDSSLLPVFQVILSDICRHVSLQDPTDLRIRRRKEPYPELNPIADFSTSLWAKIDTICHAREYLQPNKAQQLAIFADSRFPNRRAANFLEESGKSFVDAAITSPPYVTALPYIDTQRLSLCLLGLIQSSGIRAAERSLIGNREISNSERLILEEHIANNVTRLPQGVIQFCINLLQAADHESHGFRRRNIPSLTYNYFVQMAETFNAVRKLVRSGGYYVLVVGRNKTSLQGREIIIDTPSLLGELSEYCGWTIVETVSLDTYKRYGVHQRNSIRDEVLLILRND